MQNRNEIQLPSNKKFGYFFTFLFLLIGGYFYHLENIFWVNVFIAISSIFLLITLIKDDALLAINKLWMRLGILIGNLVSPIVLGMIFFGLITPIAIFMRFFRRDELRLKFNHKNSHWIPRNESIKTESFKHQF